MNYKKEDICTLVYVLIILFVGIPIWLCTTSVYRANLPIYDIRNLKDVNESAFYASDEDKRVQVPVSHTIEVMFILVHSNPNQVRTSWNIEESFQKYVKPMKKKIEKFYDVLFRSQEVFFMQVKANNQGSQNIVADSQISDLITSIESSIDNFDSTHPVIHFVTIIPDRENNDVLIKKDDKLVESNSVLIPRWGAIKIANHGCSNNASDECVFHYDLGSDIDTFFTYLLTLTGLPIPKQLTDLNVRDSIWSRNEVDQILKKETLRRLSESTSILKSLDSLLDKIHSIVINEKVGEAVWAAVKYIKIAEEALEKEDYEAALEASKIAYENAEMAFFDKSLLELLYFPDDQKYAIYIPLFLPILLPVVVSCYEIVRKFLRDRKEKEKTE